MSDVQRQDGLYAGDPIRPGFFAGVVHGENTTKRRRGILLTVALIVVVTAIVVGLAIFFSLSRKSQSYKDGYSVGGAVYAADASAQLGARQACKATELRGPHHGGLPGGANAAQWVKGCVAAFELAQAGT